VILSDQGPQFEAILFQKLCETLGIDKRRTTAYHPQTNAQAERFHRFLGAALKTLVHDHPNDWVDYVEHVEFAYRTHDVDGMGLSPYQLVYGRDPRLPIDLYREELEWDTVIERQKYHVVQNHMAKEVFAIVKKFQEASNLRNKQRYDDRHKPVEFFVGESVLVWIPPNVVGSQKLEHAFRGPFKIKSKKSDLTYEVVFPKTDKSQVVHVSRIVRYYDRDSWRRMELNPGRSSKSRGVPVERTDPKGQVEPAREEQVERSSEQSEPGSDAGITRVEHVEIINAVNRQIFVAQSGIPDAGLGVFARKTFRSGELVGEYRGELLTKTQFLSRYPKEDSNYCFDLGNGKYLDARNLLHANFARYINCVGAGEAPNCMARLLPRKKKVFIVTTREVEPGHELVYDYGPTYTWKAGERRKLGVGLAKPLPPPPVDLFSEPQTSPEPKQDTGYLIGSEDGKRGIGAGSDEGPGSPQARPGRKNPTPVKRRVTFEVDSPDDQNPLKVSYDYQIGDFVLAYWKPDERVQLGQVIQLDPLKEYVTLRQYGTYEPNKALHNRTWAKAWVIRPPAENSAATEDHNTESKMDKDGSRFQRNIAVFSNKDFSKKGHYQPWIWKVCVPEDIRSRPFKRLVRGKIPPSVELTEPTVTGRSPV
jgi:hypothetical protein